MCVINSKPLTFSLLIYRLLNHLATYTTLWPFPVLLTGHTCVPFALPDSAPDRTSAQSTTSEFCPAPLGIVMISLLRRFHGTDLFRNQCPTSSLLTLSRMRKSVHHVLVAGRFMFFCSRAAKHSLPHDSSSLNLPSLAAARPSPVARIHL